MNNFVCVTCQTSFYSIGSENTAKCPNCSLECSKQDTNQNVDFDSYVNSLKNRGGGCDSGSGCCG